MKIVKKLMDKGLTNKPLLKVKGIVIHWVANKNTSAERNRSFWENILKSGVGCHFIIDLDGTILQCVPEDMMCYQVGKKGDYEPEAEKRLSDYPNNCVIGIECTHIDDDGTMTPETYKALEELSAYLLKKHKLTAKDLWLHSEIVGKDYKDCHRWFTTTKPSDWTKFKKKVEQILNPKEEVNPAPKFIKVAYRGSSIVDALKSVKQPTDFNSRRRLASKLGIPNYSGTPTENTKLLTIIKKQGIPK